MKCACRLCQKFFAQFRCNAPDECDCPRCQGMCEKYLDDSGNEKDVSDEEEQRLSDLAEEQVEQHAWLGKG